VHLRNANTFAIYAASIAYIIEISTFPIIVKALSIDLALDTDQALWLISGYKITLIIALFVSGAAGDKIGKERVFTSGAFLFWTASVLLLFARTGEQMIILRLFQGAGAGLFSPMIPALLAANRPRNTLTALSYWGMITGAVAALYPFGAAFLTDTFSWRYGWMIVPVVTATAILRPPKPRGRAHLKTKASAPSIRRILTLPVLSVLGFILISYGISTWFIVTIALSDKIAAPTTTVGLYMFVIWSVFAVGNFGVARLNKRLPPQLLLYASVVLNGVMALLWFGQSDAPLVISCVAVGLSMALCNAPTTDLAFRLTPKTAHGTIASADIIAARLGGAIAIMILPLSLWQAAPFVLAAALVSLVTVAYATTAVSSAPAAA